MHCSDFFVRSEMYVILSALCFLPCQPFFFLNGVIEINVVYSLFSPGLTNYFFFIKKSLQCIEQLDFLITSSWSCLIIWYMALSYADGVAEGMDVEADSEPAQSRCSTGDVQRQLCCSGLGSSKVPSRVPCFTMVSKKHRSTTWLFFFFIFFKLFSQNTKWKI